MSGLVNPQGQPIKSTPPAAKKPPPPPPAPAAAPAAPAPAAAPAPKPKAAPSSRPAPVVMRGGGGGSATPWKVVILAEMLTLLGAGLLLQRTDESLLVELLSKRGLKRVIAVSALLVLLMLMADLGLGGPAALFGLVLLLGYLTANAASFGTTLEAYQRRVLA